VAQIVYRKLCLDDPPVKDSEGERIYSDATDERMVVSGFSCIEVPSGIVPYIDNNEYPDYTTVVWMVVNVNLLRLWPIHPDPTPLTPGTRRTLRGGDQEGLGMGQYPDLTHLAKLERAAGFTIAGVGKKHPFTAERGDADNAARSSSS